MNFNCKPPLLIATVFTVAALMTMFGPVSAQFSAELSPIDPSVLNAQSLDANGEPQSDEASLLTNEQINQLGLASACDAHSANTPNQTPILQLDNGDTCLTVTGGARMHFQIGG